MFVIHFEMVHDQEVVNEFIIDGGRLFASKGAAHRRLEEIGKTMEHTQTTMMPDKLIAQFGYGRGVWTLAEVTPPEED